MQNLIHEAPEVANAFFELTAAIRSTSVLDKKTNELVLIGIFTASRSLKGIKTHVSRALEQGATQSEIVSAIFLALPVCGIASVNLALDEALNAVRTIQSSEEIL